MKISYILVLLTFVLVSHAADTAAVSEIKPQILEPKKDDLEYWKTVNDTMYYCRSAWVGVYRGLFTSTAKATVAAPTPKCFGSWITKEVRSLDKFFVSVTDDFWSAKFEDFRKSWYSIGDLMFQNEEYCHFRETGLAIYNFCDKKENCVMDDMINNLSDNAFNIIIQVSKTIQTFRELNWEFMDQEERGDAIAQVGRVVSTLFADLFGFKPGHKKRGHGIDATISDEDEKFLHHKE